VPAQVLPIEFVVSDPEIRGGQPLLAGTTLRVSDLAAYHTLPAWLPTSSRPSSISTWPRSMRPSPTTSATI